MNTIIRIIVGSIAGTAAMTLYSYTVTRKRDKQFKEPIVLGALLGKAEPLTRLTNGNSVAVGWLIHYLAGLSFAACYSFYWKRTRKPASVGSGVVLGAINGVFGILIWTTVLYLHPDPPKKKLTDYLSHLMIAHLIFGAFTAIGYRLPGKTSKI